MKIAIIGASGKQGHALLTEALSRGHHVTAIVRDASKIKDANVTVLAKDLFDLSYEDIKDQDVLMSAFGVWDPSQLDKHTTSIEHLAKILANHESPRLLVVGGAGSLFVNPEHTLTVQEGPDFPDDYKPVANAMANGLAELRQHKDFNWSYLSPAADFQADGAKTGQFIVAGEEFTLNSQNESFISYADYAIAMTDEAEKNQHNHQRFSVLAK